MMQVIHKRTQIKHYFFLWDMYLADITFLKAAGTLLYPFPIDASFLFDSLEMLIAD